MTSVAVGPIAASERASERGGRTGRAHVRRVLGAALPRTACGAADPAPRPRTPCRRRSCTPCARSGGETSPECEPAWLHAIARNVCREQHRAASRRGPVSGEVDPDSLAGPQSDETELVAGLREALDSIPERQRHALVLQEWQGLAPREIAKHLGMSGPATHALLSRARHSLATALMSPRQAALGLASLVWELRAHRQGAPRRRLGEGRGRHGRGRRCRHGRQRCRRRSGRLGQPA